MSDQQQIDPHDAPDGYIATEPEIDPPYVQCTGCALLEDYDICRKARCSKWSRKDRKDVIFKKIEPTTP